MNKDLDKYFIHGFIYKDKIGENVSNKSSVLALYQLNSSFYQILAVSKHIYYETQIEN